jgi:hypothetical protein
MRPSRSGYNKQPAMPAAVTGPSTTMPGRRLPDFSP